jgi:NADH:ubiquinone oxidoreductase subunit 6 (subunit J)
VFSPFFHLFENPIVRHYTNIARYRILQLIAFPPVLLTAVFSAVALLTVPTFSVASWGFGHAFISTSTFTVEAFGELVLPLGACMFASILFLVRNPMYALLCLLGVFFTTALLYLTAGLAFVGVVFLIVYVGAVAVLFLFVIMLLNVKSLTSKETLVQHPSQVAAMAGTGGLLYQLHVIIVEALNRSMTSGFLRDVGIEPTTGEAIFFFVRCQLMDITGLAGLYTFHAILLLVTTGILLSALLGAIILATVTTERATSISDIRSYSTAVAPTTIALSAVVFFVLTFGEHALLCVLDPFELFDFDLIALSFYYRKAKRDRRIRQIRKQKQDTETRCVFDTRRLAMRRPLSIKTGYALRRKFLRKNKVKKHMYLRKVRALRARRLSAARVCKLCRRPGIFRLYAAAALNPIFKKRYVSTPKFCMMRLRWQWRWRSNRAAWLRRIVFRGRKLKVYSQKKKLRLYPRYRSKIVHLRMSKTERFPRSWQSTRTDICLREYRIGRRARCKASAVRLFGAHRAPLVDYLPFIYAVKITPSLSYWAWRIRAFCVYFICFVFLVPPIATVIWLFMEDHVVVWNDLCQIHHETATYFHKWTDFRAFDKTFSNLLAGVFILPAVLVSFMLTHPFLLVLSSLFLAYDAVLIHGGELSEGEFHESRCNWLRKNSNDIMKKLAEEQAAIELIKSRIHPDKGRVDLPPYIIPFLPWWLTRIIQTFEDAIFFIVDTFHLRTVYGCLRGVYRLVRDTVKSFLPKESLFEKYPFLSDMYNELARVYSIFADHCAALWGVVWGYIRWCFYKIEYRFEFLDVLQQSPQMFTIVVAPLCAAAVLCGLCGLVLLLTWQRVYSNVFARRPSAILYIFYFLLAVYCCGLYARYAVGPKAFYDYPHRYFDYRFSMIGYDLRDYLRGYTNFRYFITQYLYVIFFPPIYIYYKRKAERAIHRLCARRPVVFRFYANYWLRLARAGVGAPRAAVCADFLLSHPPSAESLKQICLESALDKAEDTVAEFDEFRRMKYVKFTFIPKYYDPHPNPRTRQNPYHRAFITENHYKNPFHSA